ncbi:MAG: family 43 glycosylhydrolase [Bacteroidales bacterium]|nr:family 43 glycosylhydrolase [Bacteroidales bacterium]
MRRLSFILLLISGICAAQNPIIHDQFTADPTARVFNGKVYLFASHDIRSEKNPRGLDWFCMEDYHVFSSDNLVDWTDHGVILKQEDVPWGNPAAYSMWAPDCVEKNGKYYFYFPDAPKNSRGGFAVGVAVADKPEGPYVPQEQQVAGVGGIDPCVLQCSNGDAYLIWSGGGLRAAKLKENMLEIEGQSVDLAAGLPAGFKEGPFAFERNGKFYLTYPYQFDGANNSPEALVYAMSDQPLGPYEYKGVIMPESPVGCWTNHHSFVQFNGEWYLFYHHNDYSPDFDKNRSARIDRVTFNPDGTIQQVVPTWRGVGLSRADRFVEVDRYSTAENATLEFVNPDRRFDGWFIRYAGQARSTYDDVDFNGVKAKKMTLRMRSSSGGSLRVKVGDKTIGEITVPGQTGEWTDFTMPVKGKIAGVQDLAFELTGGSVDLDRVIFGGKK